MIAPHQQITDETGQTFILLPLVEYKALMGIYDDEDEELTAQAVADLQAAMIESQNGDTVNAEVLQKQLQLPKSFPVKS